MMSSTCSRGGTPARPGRAAVRDRGVRALGWLLGIGLAFQLSESSAERDRQAERASRESSSAATDAAGSCGEAVDDPLADEFRVHYRRSVELYKAQDYAAAIAAMQRAYKLKPITRLLYNLGQAHRKLQQRREAITYFELYLQTDSAVAPAVQLEVKGHLTELRAAQAEEERQRVVVVSRGTPPPKWMRPVGFSLLGVGIATVAAGAGLWAVNGRCVDAAVPPLETCERVYATLPLGATLTAVGGGLFLTSVGLLIGSVRRGGDGTVERHPTPSRPTEPGPKAPSPSPNATPLSPDVEPPPAPLQISFRL